VNCEYQLSWNIDASPNSVAVLQEAVVSMTHYGHCSLPKLKPRHGQFQFKFLSILEKYSFKGPSQRNVRQKE
jgi:hypothetical protein